MLWMRPTNDSVSVAAIGDIVLVLLGFYVLERWEYFKLKMNLKLRLLFFFFAYITHT
jgi:hypothetical protein